MEEDLSEDENYNGQEHRSSPGRRDYDAVAEHVDAFINQTHDRFSRWFKVALGIIAFIALTTALAIFGFGLILHEQGKQADQIQATADANKQLAVDIQKQRKEAITTDCVRTNKRHDGAVAALIAGSDEDQKNAPNEAARKEIRRRRDVTIALLDALAPHQNCQELVNEAVKPTTTPTPTPKEK